MDRKNKQKLFVYVDRVLLQAAKAKKKASGVDKKTTIENTIELALRHYLTNDSPSNVVLTLPVLDKININVERVLKQLTPKAQYEFLKEKHKGCK